MKKLFILLALVFAIVSAFSEDCVVATLETIDENKNPCPLVILYNYESEEYHLRRFAGDSIVELMLTKEQIDSVMKTFQKAKEWEEISIKNEAPVTKEIPDSELTVPAAKFVNGRRYESRKPLPIIFVFASTFSGHKNSSMIGIMAKDSFVAKGGYVNILIDFPMIIAADISQLLEDFNWDVIKSNLATHEKEKVEKEKQQVIADELFN